MKEQARAECKQSERADVGSPAASHWLEQEGQNQKNRGNDHRRAWHLTLELTGAPEGAGEAKIVNSGINTSRTE